MFKHLCNIVSLSIKPSNFLSKVCSNKYLVESHWIAIIYNMGSYKLYVAVMAIAIAAVQETSCYNWSTEQSDEQEEVSEPEVEHHQCDEYKSKIWDNAFSNPEAMQLMQLTFNTAKELSSDEVCSDSIRALFNFVDVMTTNENAHFVIGMLSKMLAFIMREMNTSSEKFKETKALFGRIANSPNIREYIKHTVERNIDLLSVPEIRGRLFKMMKAVQNLVKPAENEELINQKIKGLTNAPTKLAKGAINKFGSFFRQL